MGIYKAAVGPESIKEFFFSPLSKIFTDEIYVTNNYSKNIFVAIHFKLGEDWITNYWFEISPEKTAFILSVRLNNRYVYCHAFSLDGTIWGKGDYTESIDSKSREFTRFDTGSTRGKYTINYH